MSAIIGFIKRLIWADPAPAADSVSTMAPVEQKSDETKVADETKATVDTEPVKETAAATETEPTKETAAATDAVPTAEPTSAAPAAPAADTVPSTGEPKSDGEAKPAPTGPAKKKHKKRK